MLVEVMMAVMWGKDGKAVGTDELLYEALKNQMCVVVLHRLLNACFCMGRMPTEWSKAIIHPIPKGNSSVSTKSLIFSGLSLQSCVYKI